MIAVALVGWQAVKRFGRIIYGGREKDSSDLFQVIVS